MYSEKLPFIIKGVIKTFHDKQKLKELIPFDVIKDSSLIFVCL
jgi:hypothetical protein